MNAPSQKSAHTLFSKFEELVALANRLEKMPRRFGTDETVSSAEMHLIELIGENEGLSVTELAGLKGVTKGAVSQIITKLVKKGLVRKTYAPGNAKEVVPELTELGQVGFRNHEKFHMEALKIAREYFGEQFEDKFKAIEAVMTDLAAIVDEYKKRQKKA